MAACVYEWLSGSANFIPMRHFNDLTETDTGIVARQGDSEAHLETVCLQQCDSTLCEHSILKHAASSDRQRMHQTIHAETRPDRAAPAPGWRESPRRARRHCAVHPTDRATTAPSRCAAHLQHPAPAAVTHPQSHSRRSPPTASAPALRSLPFRSDQAARWRHRTDARPRWSRAH